MWIKQKNILNAQEFDHYLHTDRKQMMQTTTLDGVSRIASKKFRFLDGSRLIRTRWLKAQVKKKTHCRANETKKR